MPFGLCIDSVRFSGQDEPVQVGGGDLIVLIGPNNAGKSLALREIVLHLSGPMEGDDVRVVTDVEARRIGDLDDFDAWIREAATFVPRQASVESRVVSPAGELNFGYAKNVWSQIGPFAALTPFLACLVDAEARLQLTQSVESFDVVHGQAKNPLQRLVQDHTAEARLSAAVSRAFGQPITVTRAGGSTLHLHLGETQAEARLDNPAYLAELAALPLVSQQGDGVRSFIGLSMVLEATPYPIVLVDEPEAFLHPPQAREMGRQLALSNGRQRFVATHDSDVLLGLLDHAAAPIIIRLRRDGDKNIPAVLNQEQVSTLWSDPAFRYSNLLNGLFHRGVVICEAEGDATLYAAALDAEQENRDEPSSDLLFTQCGGKHKMPVAIDALKPMGVPVVVIADVDVLREEHLLSRIIGSLGADWASLRDAWHVVARAVESLPVEAAAIGDIQDRLSTVLGSDRTARISEDQTRQIREATKRSDGWRQVRERGGLMASLRGEAHGVATKLLEDLEQIGLFVVPVGALEGWAPSIGGHGSGFVAECLDREVHKTNDPLREFIYEASSSLDD
jgi:AAA domain, putative AbiEii toxin, Type IV TA system